MKDEEPSGIAKPSEPDTGLIKGSDPLPRWDDEKRELRLGDRLIKKYERQPAPHQTMLLRVFQEQGWQKRHIDDPLPREPGEDDEDAKRRLHETIKSLNKSLPRGTIRFRGDGTGQGVCWEHDRYRGKNGDTSANGMTESAIESPD
jgi:hypothetical protein